MKQMIAQATNLPSMPEVVQKLIASMTEQQISTEKLGHIINSDQAITAKVLRLANMADFTEDEDDIAAMLQP